MPHRVQALFVFNGGDVNVVTGATGQVFKIDAFAFETRVLFNLSAVATAATRHLLFMVTHWIRRVMHRVAGGAIDGSLIMRAADKTDHFGARARLHMAGHANVDLLVPRRHLRHPAEGDQRRESPSAVA